MHCEVGKFCKKLLRFLPNELALLCFFEKLLQRGALHRAFMWADLQNLLRLVCEWVLRPESEAFESLFRQVVVDAGLQDLVEAAERKLDLERVHLFAFLKDADVVIENVFLVYVLLHFLLVSPGCLAQPVLLECLGLEL